MGRLTPARQQFVLPHATTPKQRAELGVSRIRDGRRSYLYTMEAGRRVLVME